MNVSWILLRFVRWFVLGSLQLLFDDPGGGVFMVLGLTPAPDSLFARPLLAISLALRVKSSSLIFVTPRRNRIYGAGQIEEIEDRETAPLMRVSRHPREGFSAIATCPVSA
jgi:hypothetical protein